MSALAGMLTYICILACIVPFVYGKLYLGENSIDFGDQHAFFDDLYSDSRLVLGQLLLTAVLKPRFHSTRPSIRSTRPQDRRFASILDTIERISNTPRLKFIEEIIPKAPCLKIASSEVMNSAAHLSYLEKLDSHLLKSTGYLEENELKEVRRALEVAFLAHYGQRRRSGEPYIIHPVEVAKILAGDGSTSTTIMSGLLHDTVEDSELTFDEVEALFGESVRQIVEGETEMSKVTNMRRKPTHADFNEHEANSREQQDENLLSLIVAMSNNSQILVVKLADRLHNMQTLRYMPEAKRKSKARETLELYMPLAQRLGLWQYKTKLSDLAFAELHPEDDRKINAYIDGHKQDYEIARDLFENTLESLVSRDERLRYLSKTYRYKDKYSVWSKMKRLNCSIDAIKDIFAVRLVLMEKYHCYLMLSKLHSTFDPIPGSFKNYIRNPKENGYQSLHTTLRIDGESLEVQIRTHAMHMQAECGKAAHWHYKDQNASSAWAEALGIDELQSKTNASEFVEDVKRRLNSKNVFVFLADGSLCELNKGATVQNLLDKLGFESMSHVAYVNEEYAGLTKRLQNNDKITFKRIEPKPSPSRGSQAWAVWAETPPSGEVGSAPDDLLGAEDFSRVRCDECLPLPDDELVGELLPSSDDELVGTEMLVHRRHDYCGSREKYEKRSDGALVRVLLETSSRWPRHELPCQFVAFGQDRSGIIADIERAIDDAGGTIIDVQPDVLAPCGDAAIEFAVKVVDTQQLSNLMHVAEGVPGVNRVIRGSAEQLSHESPQWFWGNCKKS